MSTLAYGSYSFPANRTWLSVSKREILGPNVPRRFAEQEIWNVGGTFQDSTVDDLVTAVNAFETGTATPNQDLSFTVNGTQTHTVTSAETLNGVRCVQRHYPKGLAGVWGSETEWVNKRSFQATFACERLVNDAEVVAFHQSVKQLTSGTQDFEIVESLYGVPQSQITALYTKVVVMQMGMAMGVTQYPAASAPIWPEWLKPSPFQIEYTEPKKYGLNTNTLFVTRWAYRFEAPSGLIGAVFPPLDFT